MRELGIPNYLDFGRDWPKLAPNWPKLALLRLIFLLKSAQCLHLVETIFRDTLRIVNTFARLGYRRDRIRTRRDTLVRVLNWPLKSPILIKKGKHWNFYQKLRNKNFCQKSKFWSKLRRHSQAVTGNVNCHTRASIFIAILKINFIILLSLYFIRLLFYPDLIILLEYDETFWILRHREKYFTLYSRNDELKTSLKNWVFWYQTNP